jgi:hypothetical protein
VVEREGHVVRLVFPVVLPDNNVAPVAQVLDATASAEADLSVVDGARAHGHDDPIGVFPGHLVLFQVGGKLLDATAHCGV